FPFNNEIASSMNAAANDDTFRTPNFPSVEDAFGSSFNNDALPSNDDVPF
ncbi:MAG: replicative DNA helicase, partial [Patiriisocius sp.]